MSILVILGTSAAMAKSNATSPPDRARAGTGAQVESGDGATPVTTIEAGGDASGPTASGSELTDAGSAASSAHGLSRTTASCGGTVSSVGRNLPPTSDQAGISVAISRVRANCAREPQASGLLRALERLADHGRPSSPGHSAGARSTPPGANSPGHGNGHAAGRGNGHAGAGNPGKGGHPNHENSTPTGNAGGGGKGKGAGREDG
jgi:hypothetical protein